jgi:hypothetical protein
VKLPMRPDNALPVRFEVSLDSIGRLPTERLDFLLSEAVVVSFLGCPPFGSYGLDSRLVDCQLAGAWFLIL